MQNALLAISDSDGSAYPHRSSPSTSTDIILVQHAQPPSRAATAVPVRNKVDSLSSTNEDEKKKKQPVLRYRFRVILKPPIGKSYKPNEIRLLGKIFHKVDIRDALLEANISHARRLTLDGGLLSKAFTLICLSKI